MVQTFTDPCLVSAAEEVDAEFVGAVEMEAMVEDELLVEGISIDGIGSYSREIGSWRPVEQIIDMI